MLLSMTITIIKNSCTMIMIFVDFFIFYFLGAMFAGDVSVYRHHLAILLVQGYSMVFQIFVRIFPT